MDVGEPEGTQAPPAPGTLGQWVHLGDLESGGKPYGRVSPALVAVDAQDCDGNGTDCVVLHLFGGRGGPSAILMGVSDQIVTYRILRKGHHRHGGNLLDEGTQDFTVTTLTGPYIQPTEGVQAVVLQGPNADLGLIDRGSYIYLNGGITITDTSAQSLVFTVQSDGVVLSKLDINQTVRPLARAFGGALTSGRSLLWLGGDDGGVVNPSFTLLPAPIGNDPSAVTLAPADPAADLARRDFGLASDGVDAYLVGGNVIGQPLTGSDQIIQVSQ